MTGTPNRHPPITAYWGNPIRNGVGPPCTKHRGTLTSPCATFRSELWHGGKPSDLRRGFGRRTASSRSLRRRSVTGRLNHCQGAPGTLRYGRSRSVRGRNSTIRYRVLPDTRSFGPPSFTHSCPIGNFGLVQRLCRRRISHLSIKLSAGRIDRPHGRLVDASRRANMICTGESAHPDVPSDYQPYEQSLA